MLNTETPLFCPKKTCPCYQKTDNKITKNGTYENKKDGQRRQMYYCHGGNHRFSEMAYSELFGKHGSLKEYVQTVKLVTYGLSAEQIADVLEKDPRTIERWIGAVADKSERFHFFASQIGLIIQYLQLDELWSYLKNKKRQLWVFVSLESAPKFWINFEIGSRTNYTANKFVKQLKELCRWDYSHLLRITTDKLAAYKNALLEQLNEIPYVYLQIVKQRVNRRLKTVKKCFVKGTASEFPAGSQNTSYIERLNLTLRQRISYLHRKTLGYCKNKAHLKEVLWINLVDYNYCRYHQSLRIDLIGEKCKFKKRYQHLTPGMKIGLTTEQLNWRYLIKIPIPNHS